MLAIGIGFLFCWILMIFVVLTFVIDGNVEKLVCEPYQNKKLFQILDTLYLLNEKWKYYLSGMVLNKPDINHSFEQVHSNCKDNKGIYATLRLGNRYNISEYLNIQEFTKNLSCDFEDMKVKIDDTVLLDVAGAKNLQNFSSSGVYRVDYGS